jgi:hypothetical protein
MKELRPDDPRGDQLYIQTLFDGDRYDTLAAIYEAQLQKDPKNLAAINGLISVHSRGGPLGRGPEVDDDPGGHRRGRREEQYAVGVMIFNRLYQKGAADKGAFDPRPDPNEVPPPPKVVKRRGKKVAATPPPPPGKMPPPPFTVGDVMGSERARLADIGLDYLQRA